MLPVKGLSYIWIQDNPSTVVIQSNLKQQEHGRNEDVDQKTDTVKVYL